MRYPALILVWTIMIALFWGSGYIVMASGTKDARPNQFLLQIWNGLAVITWAILSLAVIL